MKMKTVVVLAFAIGCGLIAMMGVQQMIAKQSKPGDSAPVKVLVASVDISPGVLVSENNSEFKEYPADVVPADAILAKEDYVDRGLLVPVSAGDIIRASKLGGRGEIAASASIPEGMRTFPMQVNDTKTHSGLLQPGDRVDLQISYSVRSNSGLLISKSETLLEYIEVFASDSIRNLEAGESKEIKAKNITFLVTPEQSKLIQLALTKGEIIPIIRSKEDKATTITPESREALLSELRTGVMYEENQFAQNKESAQGEQNVSAAAAFKNFISQKMAQKQEEPSQKTPVTTREVPVPKKPKQLWTVNIYAGEEVISQEFQLESQEETPTIELPEPTPRQTATPQESAEVTWEEETDPSLVSENGTESLTNSDMEAWASEQSKTSSLSDLMGSLLDFAKQASQAPQPEATDVDVEFEEEPTEELDPFDSAEAEELKFPIES